MTAGDAPGLASFDASSASHALLISGPAGIGKTHRWRTVLDDAHRRGARILIARPSEAESRLVGSSLIDLCDTVDDDVISGLPEMQSFSLARALLRGAGGPEPNPQAVATAFTSLIRVLAAEAPLIVAVDDIQWLDPETAAVLTFAARRLPSSGVALVLTLRTSGQGPEPGIVAEIGSALPLHRCEVEPLPAEDLAPLIASSSARRLSGEDRRQIVALSGGNPLYAVELARAFARELPSAALPGTLRGLVGQRLLALPSRTSRALAVAAAVRHPTLSKLAELDLADSLAPAEREDLVRIEGDQIVFVHPIYAAAAYNLLTVSERLALHRELAGVAKGAEERARHLALATTGTDPEVASALDLACARALARGALPTAIQALRLALRVTPEADPGEVDRRLELGRLLFRSGDADAAEVELVLAAERSADPTMRARVLNQLAVVEAERSSRSAGCAQAQQALGLTTDPGVVAEAHLILADIEGNKDRAFEHASRAVELREQPSHYLARAACLKAEAAFVTGRGLDLAPLEAVVDLERQDPAGRRRWFESVRLGVLVRADLSDAARALMQTIQDGMQEEYDEAASCNALGWMTYHDLWSGELRAAVERARQLVRRAIDAGLRDHAASGYGYLARGLAALGDPAGSAEAESQMARLATPADPDQSAAAAFVAGFTAFARQSYDESARSFERGFMAAAECGWREPGVLTDVDYYVEALILTGAPARAHEVLDAHEDVARRSDRASALAASARCRALLHAERGDASQAVRSVAEALEISAALGRDFEVARVLLTQGQVHRRFRQKALAREALQQAVVRFERLGALPYASRARAEMARIGGRAPAPDQLTPTEERVAQLAAAGRTRAEIGAELFLSPHTVAANLTRVYRKLGIRNRAELASRIAPIRPLGAGARPEDERGP